MSSHRRDIPTPDSSVTRRDFVQSAMVGATAFAFGDRTALFLSTTDRDAVVAQITAQHDTNVKMLQEWIALPSIADETRN